MFSSFSSGRAFASLEQIHVCWGDAQLWRLKASGNRDCSVPGSDSTLTHRSGWRNLSVAAQAHQSSHYVRSRRASQVPGEVQSNVMLVGDQSSTSAKIQTATVASPPPFPPPQPQIGSPILWIGVGVGISIVFSWAARRVQSYAMQQALKSMMQQADKSGGNPFTTGQFSGQDKGVSPFPGMPMGSFPFPLPQAPSSSVASTTTVDVSAGSVLSPSQSEGQSTVEKPVETKKLAFTDVNVSLLDEEESITWKGPSEASGGQTLQQVTSGVMAFKETEVTDGAASFPDPSSYGGQASTSEKGKGKSFINMDMLERMLDDPKVQKMVFPYLPESMRDPATFKSMIQLPGVRQQLQEALNNMGGEDGLDMLKYMNSDVVKQQFEQIGLSPEEVVGKILANPDIAASLQNPRVVEAIMDCSQNPLNITKYQNDKEVMDALLKIADLFPGATSPPY